jgi:hypothetical protein
MQRFGARGGALQEHLDDEQSYDVDLDPGPATYSFIAFNVTIPKRMQVALMKELNPEFDTERFELLTFYASNGPVTFIRSRDEADIARAHSYPFVVREFLIQELKRAEAPVSVVTTGPSPFHADIAILPSGDIGSNFAFSWEETDLLDKVEFYYDPATEDASDAYIRVVEAIRDPFSTYYFQVRAGNRRLMRAGAVRRLTQQLIAKHTQTGLRASLNRTFRSGTLAREVLLAAITAEQLDVSERSELRDDLRKMTTQVKMPRLAELCQREADRSYIDDFAMAKEVANALELGRMNQYQVFVVSASTVLGGAAGALTALIAK